MYRKYDERNISNERGFSSGPTGYYERSISWWWRGVKVFGAGQEAVKTMIQDPWIIGCCTRFNYIWNPALNHE